MGKVLVVPALVAAVLLTGALVAVADGGVREPANPPFYMRLEPTFVPHTEDWAAIIFYREPQCVPDEFNLLDFFDPPPRPFFCPLTVQGFNIWKNGRTPIHSELHGLGAVPVWFIHWPELGAAMEDGELFMWELEELVSTNGVKGLASFYQETLPPYEIHPGEPAFERGKVLGKLEIVARGTTEDGQSFQVQVSKHRIQDKMFHHVRIAFR